MGPTELERGEQGPRGQEVRHCTDEPEEKEGSPLSALPPFLGLNPTSHGAPKWAQELRASRTALPGTRGGGGTPETFSDQGPPMIPQREHIGDTRTTGASGDSAAETD